MRRFLPRPPRHGPVRRPVSRRRVAAVALAQGRDRVVVASKIDTEGALLGNMIVLLLERAGVPVENRVRLGPTKIVRTALVSGEIDIYPEYTGNGAFFHGMENDPAWKSARPPSRP